MILARERALEATLARTLGTIGRQAAQAYATDGAAGATAAGGRAADVLARAMRPALTATAQEFSHRLRNAPKCAHAFERKSFEDLDGAIARHVGQHTARAVVGISETLREAIRRVIEQAIADNLGQEETAQRIVEATAGEIALARARRIARTEIHFAAMYGQQAAAEASPLAFEKVWLSTEDGRTRAGHAAANGQRVALDQPFTIESQEGQEIELRYPGDTSAPPGEIINCRCVCLYEPLPILKDQVRPEAEPVAAGEEQPELPLPEPEDAATETEAELPERDLEARPYEREELVVWASDDTLDLASDDTPRVGQTITLRGPNTFYDDPDAPEVDREVARAAGGLFNLRRARVWRVTIPAGPELPPKLFERAGAGWTVNSGAGRFGAVPLTVTRVDKTTWGETAPKPMVEDLSEFARREIEVTLQLLGARPAPTVAEAIESIASRIESGGLAPNMPPFQRRWAAARVRRARSREDLDAALQDLADRGLIDSAQLYEQQLGLDEEPVRLDAAAAAERIAVLLEGERINDEDAGAPESVIRTLYDTRWTVRSLARWLEQLLAGDVQDKPGPGEPDAYQRVVVVHATMDIAAAVPEGYTWET